MPSPGAPGHTVVPPDCLQVLGNVLSDPTRWSLSWAEYTGAERAAEVGGMGKN